MVKRMIVLHAIVVSFAAVLSIFGPCKALANQSARMCVILRQWVPDRVDGAALPEAGVEKHVLHKNEDVSGVVTMIARTSQWVQESMLLISAISVSFCVVTWWMLKSVQIPFG
jgi:hypothetical protein